MFIPAVELHAQIRIGLAGMLRCLNTVGGGVKMRVIDLEAANFYDGFALWNSLLNDVVGG